MRLDGRRRASADQGAQLLALSHQAAQETRDVARGTVGHLRLGFVGSSLYRGLPQALEAMQQTHPQVRVEMPWRPTAPSRSWACSKCACNLALVHDSTRPEGIASQLIVDEPFVVGRAAPLCAAAAIDLGALKGDRLILFSTGIAHLPPAHLRNAPGQRLRPRGAPRGAPLAVGDLARRWARAGRRPAALERVGLPRLPLSLAGRAPAFAMLARRTAPANPPVQALLAQLR